MQFRKATWSVVAGAVAVLALSATATVSLAGAAPTSTKPAAAAPAQQSGGSRAVHGDHPTAPSAAELAKGRPAARPAAALATPRRGNGRYGPINVPSGQDYQIWSNCPGGTVATGGGESNTSLGGISLHSSYALADGSGWLVDVSNGSSADVGVTVYSVCFSGLTSYKQITQPTVQRSQYAFSGNADCPLGRAVGAGGWAGAYDQYLNFVQASATEGGWIRFATTSGSGPAATLQVICADGFNRLQDYGWSGPNMAPGQDSSIGGDCPAGTVLVSGGGQAGESPDVRITDTYPTGQGWHLYAHNDSTLADYPEAWVLCGS